MAWYIVSLPAWKGLLVVVLLILRAAIFCCKDVLTGEVPNGTCNEIHRNVTCHCCGEYQVWKKPINEQNDI